MLNVQVLDLSDRFGYLEVSRCSERRRSCKYPSAPQTAARQGSHMCSGSHVFRKEGETQSTGRHWGEQGEMYVKGYMRKCAEERQLVTDLHRQVGLDSCRDTCRGWARDWWRHVETQAWVREERFLECTRRGPNTGLMGLQEKVTPTGAHGPAPWSHTTQLWLLLWPIWHSSWSTPWDSNVR